MRFMDNSRPSGDETSISALRRRIFTHAGVMELVDVPDSQWLRVIAVKANASKASVMPEPQCE
jgi:hypothetical protein